MARKIIWTEAAIEDRYRIYSFWLQNNGNPNYSEKMETLFKQAADLLALYPQLGRQTDVPNIREKVVRSHKLFYKQSAKNIVIVRVWETHQNPSKLKDMLR
jgi:plasmid stabilization system protein ParE